MRALFTSKNLIGDALYISPALNQWYREHPDAKMFMLTLPDHVMPMYSRMGVPMVVVAENDVIQIQAIGDADFQHTFDVTPAFKLCDEKKIHIAEAYAELLGVKLEAKPDLSHLKPLFIPTLEEVEDELKGVILVSMFSASCASRQGQPPNKMLPWSTWKVILRYLYTLGLPIRYVGGPNDRTEHLGISEDEYLLGVPLNKTALIMKSARLLVTLDNGMGHLGASQEVPTFLLYPACLGLHYILPKGNPNLAYLHMDPVTLRPEDVVTVMKKVVPMLLEKSAELGRGV